ncbi:MAG: hypothetical protein ABWK53_12730 [Anaerolineales bacterium]
MQLRCTYCQTMFALSRDEMLAALEHVEEQKLKYYDAHCPKCRRANRVDRLKLELAYPNWKADLKALAKQAAAQEPAPVPQPAAQSGNAPAGKKSAGSKSGGAATKKPAAPAKPKTAAKSK